MDTGASGSHHDRQGGGSLAESDPVREETGHAGRARRPGKEPKRPGRGQGGASAGGAGAGQDRTGHAQLAQLARRHQVLGVRHSPAAAGRQQLLRSRAASIVPDCRRGQRARAPAAALATVVAPEERSTGLLLFCGHCGASSQGGRARTRLDDACIPTESGQYAISRIKRGLHPRATRQWQGYTIEAVHQMEWGDDPGAEGRPDAMEC